MGNAKAKQTRSEQWQGLAEGGGINVPVPPHVAAGSTPHNPWTLTEEFKKAAKKPQGPAIGPTAKKQIAELRQQMQSAAMGTGQDNQKRPQRQAIASKQAIAALRKKMSQPRNTWEMTPLGAVTRNYDPKRDRKLSLEIKRMEAALNKNKGQAKAAFDRFASRGR